MAPNDSLESDNWFLVAGSTIHLHFATFYIRSFQTLKTENFPSAQAARRDGDVEESSMSSELAVGEVGENDNEEQTDVDEELQSQLETDGEDDESKERPSGRVASMKAKRDWLGLQPSAKLNEKELGATVVVARNVGSAHYCTFIFKPQTIMINK
ncbi:hypothetical protein HDU67_009507 [Dinochytrium kinnereticum]|nr:hypothetical protein HDU67_009507 [Dinochytrium kinnereticum]